MARIKIELPNQPVFQLNIPVRITDINYGGHLGNDSLLSIIHECRVQFLQHFGYSELNVEGLGLIMCDVGIEYKAEVYYPDNLVVDIFIADFSRVGFDLYYRVQKILAGEPVVVAIAKTGMLFFDYDKKKVASIPVAFREKFNS